MIINRNGQYYIMVNNKIVGGPFKWHFQAKRASRNIKESTIQGEIKMDKFTKVFKVSMGNTIEKLEEANGSEDALKEIAHVLTSEKKRKDKNRAGVKGAAAGLVAGGSIPLVRTVTRTAMHGTPFSKIIAKHPGLADKIMGKMAKNSIKGGAAGLVAGGAAGAGISALRNRKKKVAESVLEEVKGRIAAKKLEEGVYDTIAKFGARALKFGGKAKKQVGTIGRTLRGTAKTVVPEFSQLRGSMGAGDALKQTAKSSGKYIGRQAAANPYGAATLAGGTGLAAWGLKKPKKVQEGAPFDFSKLKDKKGKDGGKGGKGKVPPQFAKGKDKGGDSQKDGEVNPAQEALDKAKGKAKKKGGKKELPAFLKKG